MANRALNVVAYRGIGKPAGYDCYTLPYSRPLGSGVAPKAPAGAPARLKIEVLSSTLADFDGKQFRLNLLTEETIVAHTFTFDDDTPPPSTATNINIQGLSIGQIAEEIQNSLELAGFRTYHEIGNVVWVYQMLGGDSGNTEVVFPSGDLTGELSFNDVTDLVGFDPKFYGGTSIDVPVLWGPRRGMASSTPDMVKANPGAV